MSNIIAIANQKAGRPLGFLNNALYQMGHCNCPRGVYHDVTHGGNGSGKQPGYSARVGWDAVTGWGSPDASVLVPNLIRLIH